MKTKKKLAAEIEALRDELSVVRAQLEALQADAMLSDWQEYVGKVDDLKVSFLIPTFPVTPDSSSFALQRGMTVGYRVKTLPLKELWPDTGDTDD